MSAIVSDDAVRLVVSSFPDQSAAEDWVEKLVSERHAACGSILSGAVSIYWWEGSLERATEAVVLLKTSQGRIAELLARAAEIHPYDVPELLVLPIDDGHPAYLEWVRSEVGAS